MIRCGYKLITGVGVSGVFNLNIQRRCPDSIWSPIDLFIILYILHFSVLLQTKAYCLYERNYKSNGSPIVFKLLSEPIGEGTAILTRC